MKDTELRDIIGLPATTARDHKKRETWQGNVYWILQLFTTEQLKMFKEQADKKRCEYIEKKGD
ncbi:MAG: hypothetical protein LBP40_00405 [Campylobacteraceae bacterium]|jgi:hypothetical protein|nr:hypothetical protein [Campylobacteraceae bacterium]